MRQCHISDPRAEGVRHVQTVRGSDDDARYPDEFPVGKKVHPKEVYLYELLYNEVVHTLH
jgi:hypothetical protein